ncbi:hypothetical protein BDV25DRAFT_136176 [Aspergillus avenaceus]|uniref:Uncharacterized protein n=1 Tax=Aspergillus avenaceus TaxID=36643 RepID=A0A5N6U6M9_ASPAV|nr:hypothetical protein BDV25DRAFT_136176 [Aspergillus avenaceus]
MNDQRITEATSTELDPDGDILMTVISPSKAPAYISRTNQKRSQRIFKVSSRSLVLASSYFAATFGGFWGEQGTLNRDGLLEMAINDTDPDAFEILLLLMHGKTGHLPGRLDLDRLLEVTVLAGLYHCREIAAGPGRTWLAILGRGRYGLHDIPKYIFLSWEYNRIDYFWNLTYHAKNYGPRPFDTLGLPIAQEIIEAINKPRDILITGISRTFMWYRAEIIHDPTQMSCSKCAEKILDWLNRNLGILVASVICPTPDNPGASIDEIFRRLALSESEWSRKWELKGRVGRGIYTSYRETCPGDCISLFKVGIRIQLPDWKKLLKGIRLGVVQNRIADGHFFAGFTLLEV